MLLATAASFFKGHLLVLVSMALCAVVFCAMTDSSWAAASEPPTPITDIPKISGVKVDGAVSDWKGQGLVIRAVAGENALLRKSADFQVVGRLGWNDEGVLLQVDVTDSTPAEKADAGRMFEGDSVEFFLMPTDKTAGFPQIVASPGVSKDVTAARVKLFDYRSIGFKKDAPAFTPRVAARKTEHGYIMDLVLPFSSIKVKPEVGTVVGVRFAVNDSDGSTLQRGGWMNYNNGPWWGNFPLVRLAEKASAPNAIAIWGGTDELKSIYVSAIAEPELAGKMFTVLDGFKILSSVPLALDGNRATAQIRLPIPSPALVGGPAVVAGIPTNLAAQVEGRALRPITLPDITKLRQDMFLSGSNQGFRGPDRATAWLKPRGAEVLAAGEFPKVEYSEPERIRQNFGPYTIDTAYYNAQFARVSKATAAGRYGAVSTVFLDGTTDSYTIYQTLFCTGDVAPAGGNAAALAAKAENPAATSFDIAKADREWWHAMRKKLGTAVRYEYFVRLPKGYDDDAKKLWPVIFYLHGSGRGEEPQRARVDGPQGYAQAHPDFPCIVVSLRSPGGWLPPAVEEVIDEVAATTRTDPARYYLCGFSMGAMGTWSVTEDRPERFAAVAAVGGRTGDLKRIAAIKHPPAWVFNGADDTTTLPGDGMKRYEALKAAGVEVKWTEIPNAGHVDSDDIAYKMDELYTWLLQHHQ